MATIASITTVKQLADAGDIGRCELVRGELITMSPSGIEHGVVVAAITEILRRFVRRKHLGVVCGAETGFVLEKNPDTVRGPAVGFISKHRLPGERRKRFVEGAPDLAVEVRRRMIDRAKSMKRLRFG
jgi:Uma2 family endonuclease